MFIYSLEKNNCPSVMSVLCTYQMMLFSPIESFLYLLYWNSRLNVPIGNLIQPHWTNPNIGLYDMIPPARSYKIYSSRDPRGYSRQWITAGKSPISYTYITYFTCFTHWGQTQITDIQTFSTSFSYIKFVVFWFKFHWNLFPMDQLTISQHWCSGCHVPAQTTNRYLNPRWPRLLSYMDASLTAVKLISDVGVTSS